MIDAVLGLDTSNYTTSAALLLSDGRLLQARKLLPVEAGKRGLRQSDAVFHHTRQLPEQFEALYTQLDQPVRLRAVGVSAAPTGREDSYMPCFLVGRGAARILAAAERIPLIETNHQAGHLMAAIHGADAGDLLCQDAFLALHLSGGTTECLLVSPHADGSFSVEPVARSLDLHAGQVIDRVGVLLQLGFPAGPALEALAEQSGAHFRPKPALHGRDICLSGIENQCQAMLAREEAPADIARYCLDAVLAAVLAMTQAVLDRWGPLPVLCAGGVASNGKFRRVMGAQFGARFAPPAFSSDNAAGVALIAARALSL